MKESSNDFLNFKSAVVIVFTLAMICTGCMPLVRFTASRFNQPPAQTQQTAPKVTYQPTPFEANTPYYEYLREIEGDLAKNDFAAIEKKAKSAIENKERFDGGEWRITAIHSAMDTPHSGMVSSDEEWKEHFAKLENWKNQMPDSITPILALSDSYQSWGAQARGQGYANTVSEVDHNLFEERLDKSSEYLKEAFKKKDKSPVSYELMLSLGIAQSWDRKSYEQAFQSAVKYEPEYQNYYQIKAMYLLPRWHGEPGEWEQFADDTMQSIGGKKGAEIYFEVVSDMSSYHGPNFFKTHKINWDKTREGFEELEKEFGSNRKRLNLMGRMSMHRGDMDAACLTFQKLGKNDFEPGTGYTEDIYLKYREMGLQVCQLPAETRKQALENEMRNSS